MCSWTPKPASASAARISAAPSSVTDGFSLTCIRSPKTCTSATAACADSSRHGARLVLDDGLDHLAGEAAAQPVWRVEREQASLVQQRDTVAALGLVEVRRADENRDALLEKLGEQLPELAPRDRIDAGGRLVEQDDARLVDERARQRQLLLHPAGQPVGQARRGTAAGW